MSDFDAFAVPGTGAVEAETSRVGRLIARVLGLVPGLRGAAVTERLLVAVRGSAWTFAGYGASQLLKLMSILVLARMLNPKAFGVMALVNVFLTGLEVLSDLGIGLDVVQNLRGEDPVFLDTAFVMQVARSLLLCLIAVGLAVPFAAFYHQAEVRWLAMAGALSVGVRGFSSMSVWLMTRHVQMGKLTTINVVSDATGLITSIVWALLSPTAWALVAGKVATAVAYVIVSHVLSERLPSLRWERQAAREILIFGTGIFFSSATYFFSTESERLVVGKFATVSQLGCFSLALSMAYAPFGIVQRIISNVFYPMISTTARENGSKAAVHFRKFRLVFLIASLGIGVGAITLSNKVVSLALRPQYADTAWMLQLLGFRSALELFGSAASVMLLAVGITRYAAVGNTAKLIFLAVGLSIAFSHYGLREAMWVLAVSPSIHYIVMLLGIRKRVRFAFRTELVCFAVFITTVALTVLGYKAIPTR